MAKTGMVVSVDEKRMIVRFQRTDACGKCGMCQMGNEADALCTVEGCFDAAVGDEASVEMAEGRVAGASLLAYGVPLAGLIAGLLLGEPLHAALRATWSADWTAAAGAVLGTALAFGVMRLFDPLLGKKRAFTPRVLHIEHREHSKGATDNGKR